jgi:hypothetical protein
MCDERSKIEHMWLVIAYRPLRCAGSHRPQLLRCMHRNKHSQCYRHAITTASALPLPLPIKNSTTSSNSSSMHHSRQRPPPAGQSVWGTSSWVGCPGGQSARSCPAPRPGASRHHTWQQQQQQQHMHSISMSAAKARSCPGPRHHTWQQQQQQQHQGLRQQQHELVKAATM